MAIITGLFSFFSSHFIVMGGQTHSEELPERTITEKEKKNAEIQDRGYDESVKIKLKTESGIRTLSLHDYLIGVLAAEMPVTFPTEALKAQAVAARTYTLYLLENGGKHEDADVCGDFSCCEAYTDINGLDLSDEYRRAVTEAVTETDGEYVAYNDEPILAVFHSSSDRYTESSQNVWSDSLPYLQGVPTYESGSDIPNFTSTVTVSKAELIETLNENGFAVDEPDFVLEYDECGRVKTVTFDGISVTGTKLRAMFSLRSTCFNIEATDSDIVFNVSGYGHGVGLSQYGAKSMAEQGKKYEEILKWYYQGTDIKKHPGPKSQVLSLLVCYIMPRRDP